MINVVKVENIDWYILVSYIKIVVVDIIIKQRLVEVNFMIKCFVFDDLKLIIIFDNKIFFLKEC